MIKHHWFRSRYKFDKKVEREARKQWKGLLIMLIRPRFLVRVSFCWLGGDLSVAFLTLHFSGLALYVSKDFNLPAVLENVHLGKQ